MAVSPKIATVVSGTTRYCTVVSTTNLDVQSVVGSINYTPATGTPTTVPYSVKVSSSGLSLGVFHAAVALNQNGFHAHSWNVPRGTANFQSYPITVNTPWRFVFQALNSEPSYRYSMSGVTMTLVSSNVVSNPALPTTFTTTNSGLDFQSPFDVVFPQRGSYSVTYTDGNRSSTLNFTVS